VRERFHPMNDLVVAVVLTNSDAGVHSVDERLPGSTRPEDQQPADRPSGWHLPQPLPRDR
jgi:hypothetical protein